MEMLKCEKCKKSLVKIDGDYATIIPHKILGNIEKVNEIDKNTCEMEIKCPRCKEITKIIV